MSQPVYRHHQLRICSFLVLLSLLWLSSAYAQPLAKTLPVNTFGLVESTISDIHRAFRAGSLTSEQLVKTYLERIKTTDQSAFTIPMGFTTGDLPAGIQFLGRMFDEPTLIRLTYGYEQKTHHRVAPERFSALGQ